MNTVKKLKQDVDEPGQAEKVTKTEAETPFYLDVLFWVRVGVALIFLLVIVTYFFFSG